MSGEARARVCRALEDHGSRGRGDKWQCPVPSHGQGNGDRNPSLSVSDRRDGSGVVLCCHAGCTADAVLAVLGLSWTDLRDEPAKSEMPNGISDLGRRQRGSGEWTPSGPAVAVYDYRDEHGTLLYQVCRTADKKFWQRVPDPASRSGWRWKLGDVRRVPYRLPELIEAALWGETVYICEGEKDADAVAAAGAVATTNPGGAGKWKPEYARYLDGAGKVIVVADKDRAGYAHAADVAASAGTVAETETVEAAEGKDAYDHLAAGHGLEDLVPVATKETKETQEDAGEQAGRAQVTLLADVEPEHVEWLWEGYLPLGKLVTVDGDPGIGKSTVAVDLAARVSTGETMPDGTPGRKGAVVVLSAEDGLADTIRPRLDVAGGDPARVVAVSGIDAEAEDGSPYPRPVTLPADIPEIEQVITRHGAVLVVVDVLMAYLSGTVDSYRDQHVRRALAPLAATAERTGCCIVVLRHLSKSGGPNPLYRGGGSIGIIGAARAAFVVAADPDDEDGRRRVLAPVKANLAEMPPSLSYTLEPAGGCARVEWHGESRLRASALLSEPETADERSERDEAVAWLTAWLAAHGGQGPAGQVIRDAAKDGIARTTLHRARRKAGVLTRHSEDMKGGWTWQLPEGSTKVPKIPGSESQEPSEPSRTLGATGSDPGESPHSPSCDACGLPMDLEVTAETGWTTHPCCDDQEGTT